MKTEKDLGLDPNSLSFTEFNERFCSYEDLKSITGENLGNLRQYVLKGLLPPPYKFYSKYYSALQTTYFKREEIDWNLLEATYEKKLEKYKAALEKFGYKVIKNPMHNIAG